MLDGAPHRTLWRIDPAHRRVSAKIQLPFVPAGIAVGAGGVWVTGQLDDQVDTDRSATDRIVATVKVGPRATGRCGR